MKSEQFLDYGEVFCSYDYLILVLEVNQVLIKIDVCGVCYSDIYVWEGYFDLGGDYKIDMCGSYKLFFIFGYEIVGEVVVCGD